MGSGMKLVARRLQLAMQASASECQAGSTVLGRGDRSTEGMPRR